MSSSAPTLQSLSLAERKCHACNYCGKIFTSRGRVRRHQVVHTGAKPFACSECGNKYTDQTALRRHEFLHRNETFECHHCKKTFRQFYCLSEHINKYHDGKREFACGECAKTFVIQRQLDVHVCSRKAGNPKTYDCKWCDRSFKRANAFYVHVLNAHPGEMPFDCHICPGRFLRKKELNKHVQAVRGLWAPNTSTAAEEVEEDSDDDCVIVEETVKPNSPPAAGREKSLNDSLSSVAVSLATFLTNRWAVPDQPPLSPPPLPAASSSVQIRIVPRFPPPSKLIKMKYKRADGRTIAVNDQPSTVTFADFRRLFSIPGGIPKSFKTVDAANGEDEWTMVNDDAAALPVVNGCVTAEELDDE